MKFVSKQLEMEAEEIVSVDGESCQPGQTPICSITTDTGRSLNLVSSQPIEKGDFLNVTNPEDIYHMPRRVVVGPEAKYEPAVKHGGSSTGIPIMKYFKYDHLPSHLQAVSKPVGDLATEMDFTLQGGPEKSAGLRKLLEAKDCFVRSALAETGK